MTTAKVTYLGDLRTEVTHVRSGNTLITDAPVDNHGKGEFFSPTDLVAAALLTCAITTIGLSAQHKGLIVGDMNGEIEKIMSTEPPRRIAALKGKIVFTNYQLDEKGKNLVQHLADSCPVFKSLHPDVEVKLVCEFA